MTPGERKLGCFPMKRTSMGFGLTVAVVVGFLVSPNGPPASWADEPELLAKLPPTALRVPIIRQGTDYSCGAAALLAVMTYWRVYDGNERDLYGILETTPADGTEPDKIESGARVFGLHAELRENMTFEDLSAALGQGWTVILDVQAWSDSSNTTPWRDRWEDGHYVVLVGMDSRLAYLMDPSTAPGYAFVPLDELMDRWHDYENRRGHVRRYFQAGIVIHGKTALTGYPERLYRMY